jgi:hypothetical protein
MHSLHSIILMMSLLRKKSVPGVKAGQAAARKQVLKEREKKQNAFVAQCHLDDVVVEEESLKPFRGCSKTMALQTIKGACINQLGAIVLHIFCIHNKIEGYWNKTKHQLCDMIIERKRNGNLDEVMWYPNDFDCKDDDNDSYNHEDNTDMNGTKKKKLSKGTKPREIMGDESLYCVILVYFLQELCHFVLQLGLNRTAVELGTSGFLHEPVYNKLVNVYNNAMRESLKSFKMDRSAILQLL